MKSQWHLQNFLRMKQFASVCDRFRYKPKQAAFILSTVNTIFNLKSNSKVDRFCFTPSFPISRAAPQAKYMNITCPQLSDCACDILHGKVL